MSTASCKSALICASQLIQPGTSTTLRDHGYRLVYHTMCLFTFPAYAVYSFKPATYGGLRLRRPGCLVLCLKLSALSDRSRFEVVRQRIPGHQTGNGEHLMAERAATMSWYNEMVAARRSKSLTTGNVRCGYPRDCSFLRPTFML